jgi:hypothetical protein
MVLFYFREDNCMYLTKVPGAPKGKRRCFRCLGKKKMFKSMGGWSSVDSGGEQVNCPMCKGSGWIDKMPVDVELGDIKEKENAKKGKGHSKPKEKKFEKDF